jgi:hypothetical protein
MEFTVKIVIVVLPNFTEMDKKEEGTMEAIRSSTVMGCSPLVKV